MQGITKLFTPAALLAATLATTGCEGNRDIDKIHRVSVTSLPEAQITISKITSKNGQAECAEAVQYPPVDPKSEAPKKVRHVSFCNGNPGEGVMKIQSTSMDPKTTKATLVEITTHAGFFSSAVTKTCLTVETTSAGTPSEQQTYCDPAGYEPDGYEPTKYEP